jgi:hypothetical protein
MAGATKRRLMLAAALGVIVGAATRAEAGHLTVYTDPASFGAATTGVTSINFNGIAPAGGFVNYAIPPGYTDAATGTNFTFTGVSGVDINITSATFNSPTVFPGDFLVGSVDVPRTANEVITLPSAETAVGLMFSTFSQATFVFTLSNGDSYTDTSTPTFGNVAFLGFTDTTPFTSLSINVPTANDLAILLTFEYGASVPEPPSLVLAVTAALAGLAWRAQHRRG